MAANPQEQNRWPQLGTSEPSAESFEAIPTVSIVRPGKIQILQHTLTAGLPNEYARLYLIIQPLTDQKPKLVVVERAVLVVGPSHPQRSTPGSSQPRDLAGAIHAVLSILDTLYGTRGALRLRSPAENTTVHGMLDAVVFTNFQYDLHVDQAGGLVNLLLHSGNSPSLLSYFKRQLGPDQIWKPCTRVYCRWADNLSFGVQDRFRVSQSLEDGERYMVMSLFAPKSECKLALVRSEDPSRGTANALNGINVFNLGEQEGYQNMEKISKTELFGNEYKDGLNIEPLPLSMSTPGLYILSGRTALSTVLIHNLVWMDKPKFCLQYNVDDSTVWEAVLHIMSLCDELELVSLAWGHDFIPRHASARLAELLLKRLPPLNRELAIKRLILQLIPMSESYDDPNHGYYDATALVLSCLFMGRRQTSFSASYYSDDLLMPITSQFPFLFHKEFGIDISWLDYFLSRDEESFVRTIGSIKKFDDGTGTELHWEYRSKAFLERFANKATTPVIAAQKKEFLEGLVAACTRQWVQGNPRRLALAAEPAFEQARWLLLDSTSTDGGLAFGVTATLLLGNLRLFEPRHVNLLSARMVSTDEVSRPQIEEPIETAKGATLRLSASDTTEGDDVLPSPYLHLVPEKPPGTDKPAREVPAPPADKGPTEQVAAPPTVERSPVVIPEKSTSIGPTGLKIFSNRLKLPLRLSDNDTKGGQGREVWYKVTPALATNPFMFYLLSLFGKTDKPEKTPFFVEVDTVTYEASRAWVWNKFGFEFQIAASKDPRGLLGPPAKFAFSNNRDALVREFGPDAPSPMTGYYPKEGLLVLARDAAEDDSTFSRARGGKPTNTPFTFEDLKTFLGFENPIYLAAFFSDNAKLKVVEGSKDKPARNGVWLWPMEAQRVELRLCLALEPEIDPKTGAPSSSLVKGIIDAVAPGFLVSDPKEFRLIAKKTTELDSVVGDGTTTKSSCSLDFICPVDLVVTVKGVDVTHSFQLILSIAGDSTTVQVHKPASTGALGAILGWLAGVIGEAAGIPGASELEDQCGLLFQSDTAAERSAFSLDFRRVSFTWTGETNEANGAKVQSLTAFSVDLEAQGKIGNNEGNVSSHLAFNWEKGKRRSFVGSLWNELWTTKSTTIPKGLTVTYEPFQVLERSARTRNTFDIGEFMPGVDLPAFLPTTMQSFYVEVASDGVFLSAIMVAKKPGKSETSVPMVEFSALRLRALMTSKDAKRTIGLGFSADVSLRARNPDKYPPALLNVTVEYTNEKSTVEPKDGVPVVANPKKIWVVSGSAKNLRAAHLFTLFSDADQANGVMEFIEAWGITTLAINYTFDSTTPSSFKVVGQLAVGKFVLDLTMEATAKAFTLHANLGADAKLAPPTNLGTLLRDLSADIADVLPPFVSDMNVDPSKDFGLEIDIAMAPKATKEKPKPEQFLAFNVALTLPKVEISFVQHRGPKPASGPAEITRLLRLSFRSFPTAPSVPIVGEVTPTFEQLQFVWASRNVTRKLQEELNTTVYEQDSEKLITKQVAMKDATTQPTKAEAKAAAAAAAAEVVLAKGCHFLVIARPEGDLVAVIDYLFGSGKPAPKPLPADEEKPGDVEPPTKPEEPKSKEQEPVPAADGQLAVAPLRQNKGPLSVRNISFGASPTDSTITIKLDAIFQLGPVALGLLGFSVTVGNIGNWEALTADANIEGMSIEYTKPPMMLAGALRKSGTAYTGAMVLTFPPYQLMAMGSYQSSPFTSLFILALLNGPLAQFEVAEISGVTAGFGYNSRLVLPAPAEVTTHPFLQDLKDVEPGALMATLTSGADFWFPKEQGSNWVAAGLTIKAMQTLSVKAVLAVEFGPSVQLSLFAEASAEAPAPVADKAVKPILKAKLGIIGVLNIDKGILKVEGQLAPTSYILDPKCKLTGGFAIAYWFKGSPYEGDWVFSVGGYHPAYVKPEHYPSVAAPVGISWQFGREIQIQGGAYLAVTPQCLMGGGRLSAIISKRNLFGTGSDIDVNFRAWADFLINYHPFRYMGDVGASLSLKLRVNFVVAAKTWQLNPTAVLHAEGPSFSGSLTIKGVPVIGEITVDFGERAEGVVPLGWYQFLGVVTQKPVLNEGEKRITHIISLAEGETGGLDSTQTKAETEEAGGDIAVRVGHFKINVQSKFPIRSYAARPAGPETPTGSWDLFFKPMQTRGPVSSKMTATISPVGRPKGDETVMPVVFGVEKSNVPGGLWGAYDAEKDPSTGTSAARSLLGSTEGALISHVMTLSLSTPGANKGEKSASAWIYFDVGLNKSAEVFNKGARPSLPGHQGANPSHAAKGCWSRDQALEDLNQAWGPDGAVVNAKGALDCWMALFHPPSDAIVPERTAASLDEDPTAMLSTLAPLCEPLPGELPLHATRKPEEYYLDLPRVSIPIPAAA